MKNIFCVSALFLLLIGFKAHSQLLTPTDVGSKVHFDIKNFGISSGGDISGLKGKIKFDAKKLTSASFDVSVSVSTIDTDNGKRDNHLKEADFFDAESNPEIHIISTKILATNKPETYMFTGNLSIKGVTKIIQFPFTVLVKNEGLLFSGEFEINRNDFSLGGKSISMGDNVKISLNVFAK